MMRYIFLAFCLICMVYNLSGQQRHKSKHMFRPGLSASYLPTSVLDNYNGNTKATVFMTGIHALKEIGSESYLSLGLMYATFDDVVDEEYTGIILPIRLQKFFVKERTGFNLGFGLWLNYCKSCSETIGGAYSQEINYSFFNHPVRVNVGLQLVLGSFFTDAAIHVGPQVQMIWVPEPKGKK